MSMSYRDFSELFEYAPSAEQEAVILSTAPAILVTAGAGAGKTTTMSQRIAWKVASGEVKPQEILGLTFTNKAAGELLESSAKTLRKVRKWQQKHAKKNSSGSIDSVSAANEMANYYQEIMARPTISTYNAFAAEIASSYAMLIGESNEVRLITQAERYEIFQNLLAELTLDATVLPENSWVHKLSEKYRALLLEEMALSSVIKIAGSLADKLTDNQVTVEQLTEFLTQEAELIEKYVVEMPGRAKPKYRETWWELYHGSITDDLLAHEFASEDDLLKAVQDDGFKQLEKALKAGKTAGALVKRLALLPLVTAYLQYKKTHGLIEFADQVNWACRILENNPEVGQQLRKKYKHVLLDEYQDTSVGQARMLHAAFGGVDSICAVGDPIQAIYAWRGASANALQDFIDDHNIPSANCLTLSTAYRNSKVILQVANTVSQAFSAPKTEDTEQINKFDCSVAAQQTTVIKQLEKEETKAQVANGRVKIPQLQARPGAPVGKVLHTHRIHRQDSYQALAENIQREILRLIGGEKDATHSIPTAALLVRKKSYATLFAQECEKIGLDYEIITGEPLLSFAEVRIIRAYLGLVTTPNNPDLVTLLNFFNFGAKDIYQLSLLKNNKLWAEKFGSNITEIGQILPYFADLSAKQVLELGCDLSTVAVERLQFLAKSVQKVQSMAKLPLPELIDLAISELQLDISLESRNRGGQLVQNIFATLKNLANEYSKRPGAVNLVDFLAWLKLLEVHDQVGVETFGEEETFLEVTEEVTVQPGVVQILTIHSAKGLEWDIVAIAELVSGELAYPSVKARKEKLWHTVPELLPAALRADHAHIPDFSLRRYFGYANTENTALKTAEITAHFNDPHHLKCELGYKYLRYSQAQVAADIAEIRRLVYVAVTRPKQVLILHSYNYKDPQDVHELVEFTGLDKSPVAQNGDDYKASNSQFLQIIDLTKQKIKAKNYSEFLSELYADENGLTIETDADNEPNIFTDPAFLAWYQQRYSTIIEQISPNSEIDITTQLKELDVYTADSEEIVSWPSSVKRGIEISAPATPVSAQTIRELQKTIALVTAAQNVIPAPEEVDPTYLTASGVINLLADKDAFALMQRRPIPIKPSLVAKRGTRVHEYIAHYFQASASLDLDQLLDSEMNNMEEEINYPYRDLDDGDSEETAIIAQLIARFTESRFAQLPPLAIETSVEIVLGGKPVRCTIDAVFDTSNVPDSPQVTIVDWKTGRRPKETDLRLKEWQLALYRQAWSHSFNIPLTEIDAYFYYLGEPDPQLRELRAGNLTKEELNESIRRYLAEIR